MSTFDTIEAKRRCLKWRREILDMSQKVGALHIAPAFSCVEIVDVVYNNLMRLDDSGHPLDVFLMSKGHGCMAQYVVLEDRGILPKEDMERYGKDGARIGAHPDYGIPGIAASTGSLGHGLGITAGMACTDKLQKKDTTFYCLLGDGELQEGSVWEAVMMIPNLCLSNVVALVDYNDFQGLGRTSETHPHLLPLHDKFVQFGWEAVEVNGHNSEAIFRAVSRRSGEKPFLAVCRTVKGKGVSYMENVPIWHYRSPNPEEYQQAVQELEASV